MAASWPFDPAREQYVSLATYRRSGQEVCTPVWLAGAGEQFYLFSEGKAGKVKRIRADGRARLAACDYRGRVKSPWLNAQARIVTQGDEIARAYVALRAKYGWQMKLGDFFSRLSGRYEKRAIIGLTIAADAAGTIVPG